MIYTKGITALPQHILSQVDFQCAVLGNLTLDRVICIAARMETSSCEPTCGVKGVVELCSSNVSEKQQNPQSSDISAHQFYSGRVYAGTTKSTKSVSHARVRCLREFRRSGRYDGNHIVAEDEGILRGDAMRGLGN